MPLDGDNCPAQTPLASIRRFIQDKAMKIFTARNPRDASASKVIGNAMGVSAREESGRGALAPPERGRAPLWLRTGFCICFVIAIAVVVRRLLALAYPSQCAPAQLAALDAVFE